jgi:TRAP-type C4-dicarboxylate transport system permease large subunit
VASVYAILLGVFVYRELTWRGLLAALRTTASTTTAIFAIISMAVYFSIILTYTKTPQAIIQVFIENSVEPMLFMLMAGAVYLILGTFLEVVPVFYLTVPIFYPICIALGVDPLHFYVFMVGLVGIGLLTPPVCVGVYTAAAIVNEPPNRAFRAVPGFLAVGFTYVAIVLYFPWLATWLPGFL